MIDSLEQELKHMCKEGNDALPELGLFRVFLVI